MTLINCDIGEQGPLHAGDRKLMDFIHIANVACEGHAGDKASVEAFSALAGERGVRLAAHLSYPDRGNFGRSTVRIPDAELLAALEAQLALLPGAALVKFHGALYNDAWREAALAELLAQWLRQSGVKGIIAPADSELSFSARKRGITVLREAFIDRRYAYDEAGSRLALADRAAPGAVITDPAEALAQAEEIIKRGRVNVSGDPAAPVWKDIEADTVCIHSDSPIALELAGKLRAELDSAEKSEAGSGVKGNLRLARPGICEEACLPVYGFQDIGVSPGGAMDCFSLRRGNLMLGNPEGSAALEILVPPEIEILSPGAFVLTGARLTAYLHSGAVRTEVDHGRVYPAEAGARVTFGERHYGLETYLCFRSRSCGGAQGCAPAPFSALNGWADPQGRIRVVPGPEYRSLEEPRLFFENLWRTTYKMDKVGIRLAGEPRLKCGIGNMISGAVADGTIQLTPDCPIILLRHRQTTGGYPRIFNVISADIDLLGQYAPNQAVHFVQVTLEEARGFASQKEEALAELRRA